MFGTNIFYSHPNAFERHLPNSNVKSQDYLASVKWSEWLLDLETNILMPTKPEDLILLVLGVQKCIYCGLSLLFADMLP